MARITIVAWMPALLCVALATGCRGRRIQGRCVQSGRCTEYYGKTKAELDAARGVCRLFTGDEGWFEDGSSCPQEGLVGTCRIEGDGDVEIDHYYEGAYTPDEARTRCSEKNGTFEEA